MKYTYLQLAEKYFVNDQLFEIAFKAVLKSSVEKAKKSQFPTVHIIGGQPGAGKTNVQDLLTQENENLVVCNADNFRNYHPYHLELIKFPEFYPELTADFSSKINNKLQEYCLINQLSFTLETTFTNEKLISDSIERYLSFGFKNINIHLIAVQNIISRLSTLTRYENQLNFQGFGRRVSKNDYEIRESKLNETVKSILKKPEISNFFLYSRQITSLELRIITIITVKNLFFEEFLFERNRPLSNSELKFYSNVLKDLIIKMKSRKVTSKEIDQLQEEFFGKGFGIN